MNTSMKTMIIVTTILTIISLVTKTETANLFIEIPDCPEAAEHGWHDNLDCLPRYLGQFNFNCKEGYYPCKTSSQEQEVLYSSLAKTDAYRKDYCCRNDTYDDSSNTTNSSNTTDLEDLARRVSLLETYACDHCAVISPILQYLNYGIFIATLAISMVALILCLRDRLRPSYHGVLSQAPTLIVTQKAVSKKQQRAARRRTAMSQL